MPQAFISHCTKDAEFAHHIADGLREAGIPIWIAPDSIHPGEEFVDAIQRGLGSATHFVLILSPDALDSSWVKLEMNTAIRLEREGRMAIMPILYKPCQPPLLLGSYHWIEYAGDDATVIKRLESWINPAPGLDARHHWSVPRPLPAEQAASLQDALEEIGAQVKMCVSCPLSRERTIAVPGEGAPGAQIMFIGEAPGPEDDKTGTPFVSAAGQFLDELLGLINVRRGDVWMTNIVKCRPHQNRDPEPHEIRACADYLDQQIALIEPRIIVTLGTHALKRIAPGYKLSEMHGQALNVDGRLVFPMYHPAAALYRTRYRNILITDFMQMDRHLVSMPVA